jgi:hypothetical protein
MFATVLRIAALVVVGGLATSAPSALQPRLIEFVAAGYVCIRSDRTLLVDTSTKPTCTASIGISLPVVPRKLLPVRDRQTNDWSVTRQPVNVVGTIRSGRVALTGISEQISRPSRGARSLATIEVSAFSALPTSALTDPNAIFERLPLLAEAAPNATVRLARTLRGNSFQYGAQVRDASITPPQLAAITAIATNEKIAIIVNTTPAAILPASCVGLPSGNQQLLGFGVGPSSPNPSWARNQNRWMPANVTCDELSQVQIIQAPIVGSLSTVLRPDTDTVVDATLRINQ